MKSKWVLAVVVAVLVSFLATSLVTAQEHRRKAGGQMMERREKMKHMGKHHKMKPLTEEQHEELAAFLKENDPARLEQLEELKENRPEMYEKVATKGYWGMKRLAKLKEKDPDAYKKKMEQMKLEGETRSMAREYRRSKSDSGKAKIKKQLKPKLDRLFDLRQEDRKHEVKMLKERAADLEKELAERKSNKQKIVEHHLEKILGEKDDLRW